MASTTETLTFASEGRTSRLRWLVVPLTAFLVTRILIFSIILLADGIMPGFNEVYLYNGGDIGAGFVNAWDRWDTPHYISIVESGYSYVPGYPRNNVAFYPLYPLTIMAITPLVGNPLLAGLLISNVSFLAALIVFYRLVLLQTGDESTASRAVFYIAAFPMAFFYAAVYTESLFLLLTVVSANFALRRQWLWAGAAGVLASAARASGFLLLLLVGFAWLEAQGWTLSRMTERSAWQNLWLALRTRWFTLIPILLIPVGVLLYMVYLNNAFGDPLASLKSQSGWRQPAGVQAFLNDVQLLLQGRLWPSYIMDMVVFFMVMALLVPIGRKFGVGYALYTAISLLIPASTGVMSLTRFTAVLFPVFMLLAVWVRSKSLDRVIRVVLLLFLTVFALAFVKNVFLG